MEDTLQLHEFFIEGGNAERSHALLHITEPSTPEEKQKGYFFAVCEIAGSTVEYIEELQKTIDVIEKGYYEDTEHSNAETLETVLDQVNKQSINIVRRDIELHWMVGIIAGNEIIFSFHGHPTILLFYKNKEGMYQPLDLVAQNPTERSANPTVFPQIIQGKISPNDYLVITTPHVREFYDYDRLQRIITTRSAEESCRHLERSFQESKRELSFAGIIVTVGRTIERRPAPAPCIPQMSYSSSESLQHLFSTEKNTANTLASSLGKTVQNSLARLTQRNVKNLYPAGTLPRGEEKITTESETLTTNSSLRNRSRTRFEEKENNDHALQIIRLLVAGIVYTGRTLLKTVVIILNAFGNVFRFLGTAFLAGINYQGRRQKILESWKRSLVTFRDHIYHLPLITKIFFFLTLFLIIGVTITVIYFNRQHKEVEAIELFNTTSKSIAKNKDSADGALVYQDENAARQYFSQAQNLYSKLPCQDTEDPKQQETCKKLQNDLNELATKLRHVVNLQPELVTSWENSGTELTGLVKIGSLILAYSSTNGTINGYDLLTQGASTISASSTSGFKLGTVPVENDYALFLTQNNELYSYKPKEKTFRKITFTPNKANSAFSSLLVYNRRLYALDTTNLQINRHEPIVGGFGKGTDWIKDSNQEMQETISFAIDGNLFALKKNGEIVKFTNGTKQNFIIQNLDPALTSGQALFTNTDYTYIYILDAAEGRVVILRKDGTLRAQLVASEFKGAKSFVIEEKENSKIGYVLSANKIYRINLNP